jgi:4-hydroxyphenylpyruvate dioxygenase
VNGASAFRQSSGIGGAFIYLIDRYATLENPDALSIYDIDFEYLPAVDRHPLSVRASS